MTFSRFLAYFLTYSVAYLIVALPIMGLLMAELVPKQLLERFFQSPYYSKKDLLPYSVYPLKIHRGIDFSLIVALPVLARKREIYNAEKFAPIWWVWLSYIYIYAVVLYGFFVIVAGVVFVVIPKV